MVSMPDTYIADGDGMRGITEIALRIIGPGYAG
jgi:hypothetical protein